MCKELRNFEKYDKLIPAKSERKIIAKKINKIDDEKTVLKKEKQKKVVAKSDLC